MRIFLILGVLLTAGIHIQPVTGQELMPQGTFIQTCSPPFGETFVFEGTDFFWYSKDLMNVGKGKYQLRRNQLRLHFEEYRKFPYSVFSKTPEGNCHGDSIYLRFYGPGKSSNQVVVWIEFLDSLNKPSQLPVYQEKKSISFARNQLPVAGFLRIRHPEEGYLDIRLEDFTPGNCNADVFFRNGWELIESGTSKKMTIENPRPSSFMLEKTLIRKKFFCVYIREDQARRLMEQGN
jgi:hypothetical protein